MLSEVSGQLSLRLSTNVTDASLPAIHLELVDVAEEQTVSEERPGWLYQMHTSIQADQIDGK